MHWSYLSIGEILKNAGGYLLKNKEIKTGRSYDLFAFSDVNLITTSVYL